MTSLTTKVCKKSEKVNQIKDNFNIIVSEKILDIEDDWSSGAPNDVFFSVDFLNCVEQNPPSGITPYYCVVKQKDSICGIVYWQHKYVQLKENIRFKNQDNDNQAEQLTNMIKKSVIEKINFHSIVSGNLMLTGKYGSHFDKHIPLEKQFELIEACGEAVQKKLLSKNIDVGLVLFKDFYKHQLPEKLENFPFTKFEVQPKMSIKLSKSWNNFDDYVHALKSKYRVRARKAIKDASFLIKKTFDAQQIREHKSTILKLYKNIAENAGFNGFILHEDYFENLKLALKEKLIFTTYWQDDKMIAFFTSIKNEDILDAHFLGYDLQENKEHSLYLNMLYDLVKTGIHLKLKEVDFSRTAVEIKSTVGAEPQKMYLYLRHTNHLLNKTVKPILSLVKPNTDYIIRSPFRDEHQVN